MESHRQQYLRHMVSYGDLHFDPAQGLLKLPVNGKRSTIAENVGGGARYSVRESLDYALVLLERAERSLQGRAEAIISRVIDLQETGSLKEKTQGMWPRFLGEPVEVLPGDEVIQTNLNVMTLLLIWHRHRRRLRPVLLDKIVQAITQATVCRQLSDSSNHANRITGIFVLLSGAEITGDGDLLTHAIYQWERLSAAMMVDGKRSHNCSLRETALCIVGLHAIESYVRNERARAFTEPLLARLWIDVAESFSPVARTLAEPRQRAYVISLNESAEMLGPLIEKAGRGAVAYSPVEEGRDPFGALYACVVSGDAPPDVAAALSARTGKPRQSTVCSQTW
jgi:hypothetical protein